MRQQSSLILALCMVFQVQAFAPRHSIPSRASSSLHALAVPEGMQKKITQAGTGPDLKLGDIATIKYTCYLADGGAPIARASRQKFSVGDGSMIDGWDQALRTMQVGERSLFRLQDPNLAYGSAGVAALIPSNAVVELDVHVLDAQAATTNIDFDSLALADATPRTASDIAAAFAAKQALKGNEPQAEGLELWIQKAKNFYFFGLFEGETGERPPWFLRPSITFPLAFVIVGAAFYVSYIGGAISERGAPVTDELDEIILSSRSPLGASLLAVALSSQGWPL